MAMGKRLPRKSELDRLYGEGWADDAYLSVPCSEDVTLSGPAEHAPHARETAPVAKAAGAFSFLVIDSRDLMPTEAAQLDLFDAWCGAQLPMFLKRQAA